ncbi:MAG: hypothetical protein ACPLZ9_00885 [Candidatus Ratteibacteria bacterium]
MINFFKGIFYYIICFKKIKKAVKILNDDLIYKTKENFEILVYPGKKKQSPYDFIVKYKEPGKKERTPKHVHIIIEMYVKYAYSSDLTLKLKDYFLTMFKHIKPATEFPPSLQYFKPEYIEQFKELDKVGEFSVEFLMVVTELIYIQEKTNYPEGQYTEGLFMDFGVKDRFSVIQKACWRNK